tara:strand:- start:607 stop:768 length:162 start_codon:yes stop_codon:yes gene_type:complete
MFNNLYIVGVLTVMCMVALGGCGNTVVGIGNDITKMGESLLKDDPETPAKDSK